MPSSDRTVFASTNSEVADMENENKPSHRSEEETVPPEEASLEHLFVFWSSRELAVFLVAVLAAAGVAGAKTAYALILGQFFDFITQFGSGAATSEQTVSRVGTYCLVLTGLGAAKALLSAVFMFLWITHGEVRAKAVRQHLFRSLLYRNMSWFDLRQDGMASLMTAQYTYVCTDTLGQLGDVLTLEPAKSEICKLPHPRSWAISSATSSSASRA